MPRGGASTAVDPRRMLDINLVRPRELRVMIGRQLEGETVICKPTQFSKRWNQFQSGYVRVTRGYVWVLTDRKWRDYSRLIIAGSQRICFVMQYSIVRKPWEASVIRFADSFFIYFLFFSIQIPPLLAPEQDGVSNTATANSLVTVQSNKKKKKENSTDFQFNFQFWLPVTISVLWKGRVKRLAVLISR